MVLKTDGSLPQAYPPLQGGLLRRIGDTALQCGGWSGCPRSAVPRSPGLSTEPCVAGCLWSLTLPGETHWAPSCARWDVRVAGAAENKTLGVPVLMPLGSELGQRSDRAR